MGLYTSTDSRSANDTKAGKSFSSSLSWSRDTFTKKTLEPWASLTTATELKASIVYWVATRLE